MQKYYQYNDNDIRLVVFNSKLFFKKKPKICDETIKIDNNWGSTISRAKRMVREYALCNDFDFFVTLTFNSERCDRFSLTECEHNIKRRLKTYKQYNKNFIYLLIAEKHENGAFHFHGLFGSCNPKDIIKYNKDDFEKLPFYILDEINKGDDIYYSKVFSKKTGFCTLTPIKNRSKCSSYITKYILKNPIRNENNTLYICSRGLHTSYNYPILAFDFYKLCDCLNYSRKVAGKFTKGQKYYYEDENVKIIDIRLNELSQEQIMYLQEHIKEEPTIIDIIRHRLERKKEF